MIPTREEAVQLMEEWTQSPSLRKHMLAVEAAVVAYARKYGGDEEQWAVAAILHDFDYERHPLAENGEDGHPYVGVRELQRRGYPQEITDAILGHADFSVLVRPQKDIGGLTLKSLKKKFKDKAFARGVNREDVKRGAEELGVDLWEHAQFVLEAMQARAEELGLAGEAGETSASEQTA